MEENSINMVVKKIFDPSESHNWKPSDKIPLVTREIEKLKVDLKTFLEDSDYDIQAIADEGRELCQESTALIEEMEACQETIEQKTMAEILKSVEHHDLLTKELEEVNYAINIICDVVSCGRYLKDYEQSKTFNSFTQAVEVMSDMLQLLKVPVDGFQYLTLYRSFQSKASQIWDSLMSDLSTQFRSLFLWTLESSQKKTIITMDIKMKNAQSTSDILNALHICKLLPGRVAEFSFFLLNEALTPIINKESLVFAETDELLTVTISHKPQPKPAYNSVIANLRLLFHYLSRQLNVSVNDSTTIMSMVSNDISKHFSEVLTKDCLIDTIPSSINELQSYGQITTEIEEFQHFLVVVKFFPDGKLSILQYMDNIDVLFAEKSSKFFLETARNIMVKDLSSTMSIGVETIPNNTSTTDFVDTNDEEALRVFDATIPQSLFYFPRCMISKSAQELLDLIYMIMEQAVQCSDVVCKKLYMTTKLVFELYDAVVPYHHETFLQTIPQYVALYHNNCMYLAHNLQSFGDKWLTLMEGRSAQYPVGFLELVPRLRASAQRTLARHLQAQRAQIHHYIRASDLNCIVVKDVLSDNAEQAIRQCLRQLQLLKNVWIGVFPINVFTRLMATLVNMFVDEIIHRVCTVEDISAEMAAQLTDIYTMVVKKAPNLFQKQSDIEEHVKSWVKLQELIQVLGGSLKDIEKRWDEGTGPLAVHFRTEELRSLIKALFQNTQIRANLLTKIK